MNRHPFIDPDDDRADYRLSPYVRRSEAPLRKLPPVRGWWRDLLGFVLTIFLIVSFWFVVAVVIP